MYRSVRLKVVALLLIRPFAFVLGLPFGNEAGSVSAGSQSQITDPFQHLHQAGFYPEHLWNEQPTLPALRRPDTPLVPIDVETYKQPNLGDTSNVFGAASAHQAQQPTSSDYAFADSLLDASQLSDAESPPAGPNRHAVAPVGQQGGSLPPHSSAFDQSRQSLASDSSWNHQVRVGQIPGSYPSHRVQSMALRVATSNPNSGREGSTTAEGSSSSYWTRKRLEVYKNSAARARYDEPSMLKSLRYSVTSVQKPQNTRFDYIDSNDDIRHTINSQVFDGKLVWANLDDISGMARRNHRRMLFGPNRVLPWLKVPAPLGAYGERGKMREVRMIVHGGIRGEKTWPSGHPMVGKQYYTFYSLPSVKAPDAYSTVIQRHGVGYLDPAYHGDVDRFLRSVTVAAKVKL